jgi:hypothetical protein
MERIFTNSRTVADRLRRYNGLEGEPLYHPPPLAGRLRPGPFSDYVLWVGRLEANKRPGLLLDALALTKSRVRAVFAGRGRMEDALREAVARKGWKAGSSCAASSPTTRRSRSTRARAVVYPPFHEDLGYVTLEAFLAGKPVITMADSGGPTEFVRDGVNGSWRGTPRDRRRDRRLREGPRPGGAARSRGPRDLRRDDPDLGIGVRRLLAARERSPRRRAQHPHAHRGGRARRGDAARGGGAPGRRGVRDVGGPAAAAVHRR